MTTSTTNCFLLGWSQVPIGKAAEAKSRIMDALGISTRASWSNRLRGLYFLSLAERTAIENVFADYGIDEVWGCIAPFASEDI